MSDLALSFVQMAVGNGLYELMHGARVLMEIDRLIRKRGVRDCSCDKTHANPLLFFVENNGVCWLSWGLGISNQILAQVWCDTEELGVEVKCAVDRNERVWSAHCYKDTRPETSSIQRFQKFGLRMHFGEPVPMQEEVALKLIAALCDYGLKQDSPKHWAFVPSWDPLAKIAAGLFLFYSDDRSWNPPLKIRGGRGELWTKVVTPPNLPLS